MLLMLLLLPLCMVPGESLLLLLMLCLHCPQLLLRHLFLPCREPKHFPGCNIPHLLSLQGDVLGSGAGKKAVVNLNLSLYLPLDLESRHT